MNHDVAKFKRKLKSKLQCSLATKSTLMADFDHTLASFLEEHPDPTFQNLCEAFGPPEEMALTMMEQVSDEEQAAYRRSKLLLRILAAVLATAFVAFTIYVYFIKQIPLIVTEETTLIDETYIPDHYNEGE